MYQSTDPLLTAKPVMSKQNEKQTQLPDVKAKLRDYAMKNNNVKDNRLLECHAHCFISLS